MTPTIQKADPPARLSKRVRDLFSKAEEEGFAHLGWLAVTVVVPIKMATFTNEEGDIALAFSAWSETGFAPTAIDMVSQFERKRKLTTTTHRMVIPQPHRGIFKYSYPDADIAELFKRHRKHMTQIGGRITIRVHTLEDFATAVRKYVQHELPG